jgi:hypothetical protein
MELTRRHPLILPTSRSLLKTALDPLTPSLCPENRDSERGIYFAIRSIHRYTQSNLASTSSTPNQMASAVFVASPIGSIGTIGAKMLVSCLATPLAVQQYEQGVSTMSPIRGALSHNPIVELVP